MDHGHDSDYTNVDDSSDISSTYCDNDSDDDDQFDLLSFMSVISEVEIHAAKEWTAYTLLSIHLGPWNSFHRTSPYRGNSFAVTLITKEAFLRSTPVSPDDDHKGLVFPQLAAVKTPLLEKGDNKKGKNSHLFRSISKEYQILRSELLRNHENVINAYGCCWQSLEVYGGLPIPCLILEGTELGDLAGFCQTHELTLRERLGMCVQITMGLQAVHAIGIIHGDLKPRNILVFCSEPNSYVAKLADFGEAIVLAQNKPPFQRPTGTALYYAPECYSPSATFDENGLLKAEIFSLGIVLSSLIQGMHILEEMKNIDNLESLKKNDTLVSWLSSLSWKDPKSAPSSTSDESIDSTNSWETDPNWSKNSPLADEHLWDAFISLLNGTLATNPIQRFKSDEQVLTVLRTMVGLNLRRTLMYQAETSDATLHPPQPLNLQWAVPGSAQWSAQHAAQFSKLLSVPMSVSKAKLRKATGNEISISKGLDKQEVEAVVLSCLMKHDRPNFSRDFRFIEKYSTGKRSKTHLTKRQMHLFRPLHVRRESRIVDERDGHNRLVLCFTHIAFSWTKRQRLLAMQMALKLVERGNSIFKVTNDSNLFWLLPYHVKALLEDIFLQEASTVSSDISRRADAAFEYTNMVLNSGNISGERLGNALSLLAKSAQMGNITARATFGRLHGIFNLPPPVSPDIETAWLLHALEQGSLTAWRRLKAIDPLLTRSKTCSTPYNHLRPEAAKIFKEDMQQRIYAPGITSIRHAFVQHCAGTGDTQSFLDIARHVPGEINFQNCFGETPLMVACRGGHATMVALLLQHNADPRIATKSGVTALHFLSAFDDEDIPRVAALLLKHGAELEKQSEEAVIYKSTFDCLFMTTGGTPLQWAVIAGNSCATQSLLNEGADPFMEEIHPTSDSFIGSPMMWAATLHQFQLLKILLTCTAKARYKQTDIKRRLNEMPQSILTVAIDANPGFKFREYLINGKDLELNALKCVQILIEHGIDPTIYSRPPNSKDSHPILLAATSGNNSILEFFWDYKGGLLRPTPEVWISALKMAIFEHRHSSFDFLAAHRGDITASPEAVILAVGACLTITADKYFTLGCVNLALQPGIALRPKHLMKIFYAAILSNNFETAKLFFEHGVDLTARIEVGETILGGLIEGSSEFPNIGEKVSFLLSLQENPDTLFWNVTYLDRNGLTALQAVVSTARGGKLMNSSVFDTILEKFGKENYLNAKMKGGSGKHYKGWTALHLAARYGNLEAVIKLSQAHGIDLNPESSHGETPVDIAIDGELNFARKSVWEIHSTDLQKRNSNTQILNHLLSKGGRVSKYSDAVRKLAKTSTIAVDDIMKALRHLCLEGLVMKRESTQSNLMTMSLQGDPIGALRKGGYLPSGW